MLAVAAGTVAARQYSADRSARAVVRAYFAALRDGDAPAALAFADQPPNGDFLTSQVLHQQLALAPLSDVQVDPPVTGQGGGVTVGVRYRLAFPGAARVVSDEVALVRHGSSWRLVAVSGTVRLRRADPGAERITVAGRPPVGTLTLFPGAVPLVSDNPAVRVTGQPTVLLATPDRSVAISTELTPAAKAQAALATDSLLTGCLDGSAPDPRCPASDTGRVVPGSLRGTVGRAVAVGNPQVSFAPAGRGLVQVTGDALVTGRWQVWDFNNQPQTRSGPLTLTVRAQLSIADLSRAYWQDAP